MNILSDHAASPSQTRRALRLFCTALAAGLVLGMLPAGQFVRVAHIARAVSPLDTLLLDQSRISDQSRWIAGSIFDAQAIVESDALESASPDQETATPTPPGTVPAPSATPAACPTLVCPGCPGPRPAIEWLEEADAVFRGKVTGIDLVVCDHRVWFEVTEVWKGPLTPTQSAWVDLMSWQCMRRYYMDDEVIVFARADEEGNLNLPMCFGITDGDVEGELGPGTPVGGTVGTETPSATTPTAVTATLTPTTTTTPTPTHDRRLWLPWLDAGDEAGSGSS